MIDELAELEAQTLDLNESRIIFCEIVEEVSQGTRGLSAATLRNVQIGIREVLNAARK